MFVTPLVRGVAGRLHKAAELVLPPGRRATLEALGDRALDCAAILERERHHLHRASLGAIAIARSAQGDTTWQRVVHRAFLRLRRSIPDPLPFEVWARAPIAIDSAGFRALLQDLPHAAGEPWSVADPYGGLHGVVPFTVTESAVVPSADGAFRVRDVLVLCADVVSVSPAEGRVRITTQDPERALALVAAIGARGLADCDVLIGRPAFTLRPLLERADLGLATMELPLEVRSIKGVACQVVKPDGERDERRGKDALCRAADVIAKDGGYPHRVTLRLAVDDADEPVDVLVQLPNRVSVSDVLFAREAALALSAASVDAPGSAADDLTTLAHGARVAFRWCEVFGEAIFEAMKAAKLLVLVRPSKSAAATGVALPELRAPGDTLRVWPLRHPLDAGNGYALADDPLVRARTVTPKDRETWRLDRAALATRLARDLGLDVAPPCKGLPDGVLDLGRAAGGHARVVYVLTRVAEPSAAHFASEVSKAVLPAHAVMLVPRGAPTAHALSIELDLEEQVGLKSVRDKLAAVLATANLGALASSNARERRSAFVVVALLGSCGGRRTEVSIDGAIRSIQDSSFVHLFAVLVADRDAPGAWQPFAFQATRQHTHEAIYRMHATLEDVLPDDARLIETGPDGYRLGAGVRAGEIAWESLSRHPNARVQRLARKRGAAR